MKLLICFVVLAVCAEAFNKSVTYEKNERRGFLGGLLNDIKSKYGRTRNMPYDRDLSDLEFEPRRFPGNKQETIDVLVKSLGRKKLKLAIFF